VFCLVKTSNAGGTDVQDLTLSDGNQVWQHVAKLVAELGEDVVGECGLSSVGAVVGATYPRAVSEARKLLPQSVLLLPGIGAQGATPADVARAFTSGPASALVTVSRSVIYAYRFEGGDWRSAAARVAAPLAFLAAVTVAVLLVRAGLDEGSTRTGSTVPTATAPTSTTPVAARRFYRIRPGDTLAAIAPRFGLTEVELVALNPGIEPTALRIGQRIRVR
jgi:hypothetical protein